MQRGGTLQGQRRRRQPRRRRSLLKPRPKRGILAPSRRQPYPGSAGRTVRIPTQGGQLAEIALPLDTGNAGRWTATGRRMFPFLGRRTLASQIRGTRFAAVRTQPRNPKANRTFRWNSSRKGPPLLSLFPLDPSSGRANGIPCKKFTLCIILQPPISPTSTSRRRPGKPPVTVVIVRRTKNGTLRPSPCFSLPPAHPSVPWYHLSGTTALRPLQDPRLPMVTVPQVLRSPQPSS